MNDPDATVVRAAPGAAAGADPDATVQRPVTPRRPSTGDETVVRARPAPGPRAWPATAPTEPMSTQFPATRTFVHDDEDNDEDDRDPTTIVSPKAGAGRPGTRPPSDATTVVLPHGGSDGAADRGGQPDDTDATVIRNTLVRPHGTQADVDRTLQRGSTIRALPKRSLALPSGLRLHEYRIERVLGQGGFGITYLATDANLDAQVAIKEYLPEEIAFRASDRSVSPNASLHRDRYQQGLENFLTEARTLASFRHPNIVRVARFFEAHHTAYMVLEYERGRSFKKWWLKQSQAMTKTGQGERLLVERLQPLLDGLSAVHAAGYLHRDIKPDNIQVRAEDGRLVLLDFGSAGQTVALADQDAVVVTPGYAPIEQYGIGEQGAWTDIYALGATLYWAVAGQKPPDAETRASGITMPPAVEVGKGRYGRAFLEAIDWALETDPTARPATVDLWRDKLLADHVSSLGLKEALRREDSMLAGEAVHGMQAQWSLRLRQWWHRALSPSAWTLAAKLTVAMLVTALIPMLVTGLYNLRGAEKALQATQLRKTELVAHTTAGRMGQLLGDSAKLARGLGGDADVSGWLTTPDDAGFDRLQQRLTALVNANPDIQFVMVMDPLGGVRVSTDRSLLGRNFAFREYFKEAMAGKSFTTGILVGAGAGAAGVFFSEPVRDAAGQVLGAVVLRVHATAFGRILDEVRHDTELTPFMVDGDGVVVQHPNAAVLFHSLMPLPAPVLADIQADQRFRRDRIDSLGEAALSQAMMTRRSAGNVAFRSTSTGVDEIAGFAPVPGHDWRVVVSQTREAFEQPVMRLLTHLQWSLALVGLVFTVLALRFARTIVRPVRALTAGAHALKSGQFEEAYVDVKGRDELGQLARTFNVMVDVLRQRERERDTRRLP
jgi:serine/threonine protein kinase/HAMP domain-containing protein